MKIRQDRRLRKILLVSLGLAALMSIAIYVFRQSAPQPDLECYEELVTTMTTQQVANLFDVSLVELTWLPDDIQTTAKINTYPSIYHGHPEQSRCEIIIEYPHPNDSPASNLVSIRATDLGYIEATRMPESCSWNFTPAGPTGSSCSLDLEGTTTTIRVWMNISPQLPPDTILQILDGMIVVEPQN